MVSSLDEDHPGENIIDGSQHSYWISTGCYPQEILLQLGRQSQVSTVRLATTNVKNVRVEGCSEDNPVNFHVLAEGDLEERQGSLQLKDFKVHDSNAATYIKVLILSGWHDFCSVHQVMVE